MAVGKYVVKYLLMGVLKLSHCASGVEHQLGDWLVFVYTFQYPDGNPPLGTFTSATTFHSPDYRVNPK